MLNISQIKIGPLENPKYIAPFRFTFIQNDVQKDWELVSCCPSVAIILYHKTHRALVCVKQFRPGVYWHSIPIEDRKEPVDMEKYPPSLGVSLEFCAGMLDKNKTAEETAAEEVLEECGYQINPADLLKITSYRNAVGSCGDIMTLYYTEIDVTMKVNEGGGVDDELIEIVEIPIEECKNMLNSSSLTTTPEFLYGLQWFCLNKYPKT